MEGDSLDEVAHLIGLDWAERVFTILENRDEPIPGEWPGTVDEARAIAASYVDHHGTLEDLAQQLQIMAKDAWRELAPDAGEGHRSPGPPRTIRSWS